MNNPPTPDVNHLIQSDLLIFYGWWQLSVCAFAFAAFLAIWWHIGRKQKDFGQIWFALSVLCWSISGGVEVYYAHKLKAVDSVSQYDSGSHFSSNDSAVAEKRKETTSERQVVLYQLEAWQSIFSLFNSLFILFALPWFRYIPSRLQALIKSQYWPLVIGLPFLFSLIPTISKMVTFRSSGLVSELDVYYSTLTLIFLGYVLWESFDKRRLPALAWLSSICIIITFTAQVYKLTAADVDFTLFSAIFKTSLIMIFFALALSWIKELAENVIPDSGQLYLEFKVQKDEEGQFERKVRLLGIPGRNNTEVTLTPALYELLFRFASKKAEGGDDWLEIKPKKDIRSNKTYDINDHNEIKRLVTSLLDGLFGKGCWSKKQHEEPFRQAMFQMSDKRERKIRLAIPVSNITL